LGLRVTHNREHVDVRIAVIAEQLRAVIEAGMS